MNAHDIASAAEDIAQQAQHGPGDKPGELMRNNLSPHFPRFIFERVRKLVIGAADEVEALVAHEAELLKGSFDKEDAEAQISTFTARILAHVRTLKI